MARMCGYPATLKADAFPTIKSKKSAARPPLNLPECVSNSGTKDLGSTASNGGSLFPQTSELNPLDVLAHTVPYATEDDQEKNIDPSFPGLLTSTPKLDRSAFRKRARMRVHSKTPGALQCKRRSDWSAHQELVDGTDTGPKCLCSDEERCDSEMPRRLHGREWTGANL
nr:uncharacterized protein LOC133621373 isoform X3 [Nerophis lumbriciformis]